MSFNHNTILDESRSAYFYNHLYSCIFSRCILYVEDRKIYSAVPNKPNNVLRTLHNVLVRDH